jgi:hypothetical protein
MRSILIVLGLLVLALSFAPRPASAADSKKERHKEQREEGWVELGTREVDYKKERDVIEVGRQEGRFTRIRLEVDEGDMKLSKLKVTFGNGETFEPDTRYEFNEGTRSHNIDLPDKARAIKRVEFVYKSEKHGPKAVVTLLGKEK